jgi:hypothetical protein
MMWRALEDDDCKYAVENSYLVYDIDCACK